MKAIYCVSSSFRYHWKAIVLTLLPSQAVVVLPFLACGPLCPPVRFSESGLTSVVEAWLWSCGILVPYNPLHPWGSRSPHAPAKLTNQPLRINALDLSSVAPFLAMTSSSVLHSHLHPALYFSIHVMFLCTLDAKRES